MRSLYTDDIPGAHPKIRHFDKKIYRPSYPQQALSAIYPQSYMAAELTPQPLHKSQSKQYTMQKNASTFTQAPPKYQSLEMGKPRNQLSNSQIIDWRKVELDSRQSRMRSQQKPRASKLSQVGMNSILSNYHKKLDEQPYYPHYFNAPKDHETNKFTGRRYWNPQSYTQVIYIPSYKGAPKT